MHTLWTDLWSRFSGAYDDPEERRLARNLLIVELGLLGVLLALIAPVYFMVGDLGLPGLLEAVYAAMAAFVVAVLLSLHWLRRGRRRRAALVFHVALPALIIGPSVASGQLGHASEFIFFWPLCASLTTRSRTVLAIAAVAIVALLVWPVALVGDVWTEPVWRMRLGNSIINTCIVTALAMLGAQGHRLALRRVTRARASAERAFAEAHSARDLAERASRTRGLFLTMLSHELRTPLSAIIGYSELIEEEADATGAGAALPDIRRIRQAASRHLARIDQILDLCEIESGDYTVELSRIELPALLDEVVSPLEPLASMKDNTLALRCPPDGIIVSDRARLRQALTGLVHNAHKFTEGGLVEIDVEARRRHDCDGWTLTVRDDGVGFDPARIEQLLAPFERQDLTPSRRQEGAGVGLALVHRCVETLHGRLEADGAPGRGATFQIWLPADLTALLTPEQWESTRVITDEYLTPDLA